MGNFFWNLYSKSKFHSIDHNSSIQATLGPAQQVFTMAYPDFSGGRLPDVKTRSNKTRVLLSSRIKEFSNIKLSFTIQQYICTCINYYHNQFLKMRELEVHKTKVVDLVHYYWVTEL